MKTLAQTLFGEASPVVLLTIMTAVLFCLYLQPNIAIKKGKKAGLKFAITAPVLMIIVSILANDGIGSFFWGFALIYILERIRKEEGKV